MSDSFSDLWNSSAPSSVLNKPASTTLGSAQRSGTGGQGQQGQGIGQQRRGNQPDLFSLLAPSSTSSLSTQGSGRYGGNAASRSITPSLGGVGSASTTPRPASGQSMHATSGGGGGDAFKDLLSSLPGNASKVGSGASQAQMTLAARQAKEAERRSSPALNYSQQQQMGKASGPVHDAWSGLDSLGSFGAGAGIGSGALAVQDGDDWDLGDFGSAATTSSRKAKSTATSRTNTTSPLSKPAVSHTQTKNVGALWDLDEFANPSTSSQSAGSSNVRSSNGTGTATSRVHADDGEDDWGLADFGAKKPPAAAPTRPKQRPNQTTEFDSPEKDFDFGVREDLEFEEPVARRPRAQGNGKGLLDLGDDEDIGGFSGGQRSGLLLDSDDEHSRGGGGLDDVLGDLSRPVEEVRKRTVEPVRHLHFISYFLFFDSFSLFLVTTDKDNQTTATQGFVFTTTSYHRSDCGNGILGGRGSSCIGGYAKWDRRSSCA